MRHKFRARWAISGSVIVLGFTAACDVKNELLQPQNPGLIDQSAVGSPTAAAALKIGAMGRLKWVVSDPAPAGFGGSSVWEASGLLSDEFMNSDFQNSQNDVDQRTMSPDNVVANYSRTTQARGFIRDAIAAEVKYEPTKTADIGELYMALGFIEMTLAENFCNGIPLSDGTGDEIVFGQPLPVKDVFNIAIASFDTAIAMTSGTDAASVNINRAAKIGKARALLGVALSNAPAAAALVAGIPTTYKYDVTASLTGGNNVLWSQPFSQNRYSLSDASPASSVNRLSCTFTISAFLRRQIEQSQVVSSGKSVSMRNRTRWQWQLPVQCCNVRAPITRPGRVRRSARVPA